MQVMSPLDCSDGSAPMVIFWELWLQNTADVLYSTFNFMTYLFAQGYS